MTLKIRCDKVNKIMDTVGLTHQGFLKLRDKYYEWRESNEDQEDADEEADAGSEQQQVYLK